MALCVRTSRQINKNIFVLTFSQHIINVIKPGGLFIFNLRAQTAEEYNREFDTVVSKVLQEGKMVLVEKTDEFPLYQNNTRKVNAIVYVYRRL